MAAVTEYQILASFNWKFSELPKFTQQNFIYFDPVFKGNDERVSIRIYRTRIYVLLTFLVGEFGANDAFIFLQIP
jgi:hypothetical protein